jgi:hypothetical protein
MAIYPKERYDPRKIERLSDHLRLYYEKGQPIDYEIIVDGFKVVRRTNDPSLFSMYEEFIDGDTKNMEVLLYTGSSYTNDKRIYYFGDQSKEELSGLELKAQMKDEVKQENRLEDLEKENKELTTANEQLKKDLETLEKEKDELEASQSPLKGVLGEIGSSFVESFLRRNPQILKGIPGGEALAGLIGTEDRRPAHDEQNSENTEVSFKPRNSSGMNGSSNVDLTEEERAAITFVNQLKTQFSKEEFDNVLLILQTLANDKSKIELILNHVNIKQSKL